MSTCFNNHIGLKGCSTVAPTSGIWINSLPGISSELSDKIANSEQITFAGVWSDVKTIAKQTLINDIVNGFEDRIRFSQLVYQTKRPRPSRIKTIIAASAEYRGFLIEAPESRYSQIYIKTLFVYSTVEQTASVKVWNVWDSSEIISREIDLIIGLNEVAFNLAIDLTFSENSVFVGLDSSLIDTVYFLQELDEFWDFWQDDCPYNGGAYGSSQQLRISAATMLITDEPSYETIVRTGNPPGVWAQVEIVCSEELFVCENIHHFTSTILNLLGYQLLLFKIASPRQNYFTYAREDVTEKLMLEFKQNYQNNLKRTLLSFPGNGSGFCFDCSEKNTYFTAGMLP